MQHIKQQASAVEAQLAESREQRAKVKARRVGVADEKKVC